ncbi:MAG: IPTL-CTERM sorting domain-containing protein [Betaproteobacteria bacterium]|nr:IPTL-CTERM sorting domain-containing protein [Betaproteobacteria bacterium]
MRGTHRIRNAASTCIRAITMAFAVWPLCASAQSWSGLGGDSNWSTGANWTGGVAPPATGTTTSLVFGPSGNYSPVVDAAWEVNALLLGGATAYALTGSALTVNGAGAVFDMSGAAHSIANALTLSSPLTISHSVDVTLSGAITGPGAITKNGAARLTSLAASDLSGGFVVNSGTLRLGDGVTWPLSVGPISNGAALEIQGFVNLSGVSGTGSMTVVSGGAIGMFGDFTHTGATTLGPGAYAGGNFTQSGPLTLGAGSALDTGLGSFASLTGTGTLNINGPVTVGTDNADSTFTGILAGFGALTKVGTGRLTLGVPSFHTGTATVSAGTLRVGDGVTWPLSVGPISNGAALEIQGFVNLSGVSGTGSMTVVSGGAIGMFGDFTHTGATTLGPGAYAGGNFTQSGPLTLGAGSALDTGLGSFASLTGTGTLNINGPVTVGTDNADSTFTGILAGFGALTKVGTGRLTLGVPSFHTGTATVSAGTLRVGDGVTWPLSVGPISNGAALEIQGFVNLSGVSGTGSMTVVSGGAIGMFGDFTHTGATTLEPGAYAGGNFTQSGPLTLGAGSALDTGLGSFASLTGTGTLNINGPVTVGTDNADSTFTGILAGFGALTKVGTGRLTLAGASTNLGTMSVSGGSVLVTGSMTGPVTVNAGGTLGGTGTVSGSVTVNAGGTIAPGLSPGVINTGSVTLGGATAIEILGTTLGTQYDNINVTGTVTIAGGTLSLSGAYVPVLGDVFTIISNDGADAVTGTFAGLAEGATIGFNGATLRISYVGGTGNDVVLTVLSGAVAAAPVPTLSEWLMVLLATLLAASGMLAARRRN